MRFDGSGGAPKIGIFADSTDVSMPIVDLAKAIEDRGFTGLYVNEHPHLPVDGRRSEYPPGGEIPETYARFWCPYAALSFVAVRTTLEVGPMVSLIGEHDPIALAKTIATIDVLSEGRFVLGVGWGWHREEFEAHGFPANRRAQVMEDHLMIMKALWTQEVAAYEGSHVSLAPSRSWPKPVSVPHTPVFGGVPPSDRNVKRLARWADGWIPMFGVMKGDFGIWKKKLEAELEEVGRDPAAFRLMTNVRGADGIDLSPERADSPRWKLPADELKFAIDSAAKFGLERLNLHVGAWSPEVTVGYLDDLTDLVSSVL